MCHSLSSTLLFAVPSVLPHPHSTGFRPFCLEEKQSVIAEVYPGRPPLLRNSVGGASEPQLHIGNIWGA